MLTISINEALAMSPEPGQPAATEWGCDYSWTGYESAMQTGYLSHWDPSQSNGSWEGLESTAWSHEIASGDWSKLLLESQLLLQPTVAGLSEQARKLPLADGAGHIKPATSWASPLRVPLPEPVSTDSSSLISEMELEAQLTATALPEMTLARAASPRQEAAAAAELPLRVEAPPQLPPGLYGDLEELVSNIDTPPAAATQPVLQKPAGGADVAMPPGMSIHIADGCTRVEWQIEDLRSRLLANMGRPLVSPSISAPNLPNLRLMVLPDAREVLKNSRSSERKKLYDNMIKKGPLHGALKLKVDCLERATIVRFNLTVGSMRVGSMTFDFADQAIHGSEDFAMDWLKQVDKQTGSLSVGVEILEVKTQAEYS